MATELDQTGLAESVVTELASLSGIQGWARRVDIFGDAELDALEDATLPLVGVTDQGVELTESATERRSWVVGVTVFVATDAASKLEAQSLRTGLAKIDLIRRQLLSSSSTTLLRAEVIDCIMVGQPKSELIPRDYDDYGRGISPARVIPITFAYTVMETTT